MADRGGLQLLPETRKKIEVITPGENRLLVIGGIIFGLVAVLAGGIYFYQTTIEDHLTDLDADLATLEQQRDKQAEKNILIFNKQVAVLSNLLNKHIYWTTGFSKIESLTQTQIQFDTLTATAANNVIGFEATAANYTTIARQIAAFLSDESITDITLSRVNSLTDGRLTFAMQITFDRNKFLTSK